MQIAYVMTGFPYPLTSGYLRHYHFIKGLARSHRISLLSIAGAAIAPDHVDEMRRYTDAVFTFRDPARGATPVRKAIVAARSLLGRRAPSHELRAALRGLLSARRYDALVLSGRETFAAVEDMTLPPLVADLCDAASLRLTGEMRYAPAGRRQWLWMKTWQSQRWERRILARASHTVFASERDRRIVVGDSGRPASVIPNGVDLQFWKRSSGRLGRNTVVMTGAMHYPPNVDAALFLANDIMPAVRRTIHDARALIVGHSPTPALIRAGEQPGVTVTGSVPDVRPYLEEATVFVAPLRFGAGIQNKLLEAMAMEMPVITSALAADGLRGGDHQEAPVEIAHTAKGYAAAIAAELGRRGGSGEPAVEGRRYVERHFSWPEQVGRLDALLAAAVRSPS